MNNSQVHCERYTGSSFDHLEMIYNLLFHIINIGIIIITQNVILLHLPPPTAVVSVSPFFPQMLTLTWQRRNNPDSFICNSTTGASGWVEAVRCCSKCTRETSGPLIKRTECTHSINLTRRLHL